MCQVGFPGTGVGGFVIVIDVSEPGQWAVKCLRKLLPSQGNRCFLTVKFMLGPLPRSLGSFGNGICKELA